MLTALVAAALTFATPQGWQAGKPTSGMRFAEFTLPKTAGDAQDAQLIIYYFGKEGAGSIDDNMERWIGQMQQPDGKPSKSVAKRETRTVNGLKVTLLDVTGIYAGDVMGGGAHGGGGGGTALSRMRAGVIETPNGPYFIKLTGPVKTVTTWEQAFAQFIASLKYQ